MLEEFKTARGILSVSEIKHDGKSSIYIQLLLEKFNSVTMDENSSVVNYVSHAKYLLVAGNPILVKSRYLPYLIVFLLHGTQLLLL